MTMMPDQFNTKNIGTDKVGTGSSKPVDPSDPRPVARPVKPSEESKSKFKEVLSKKLSDTDDEEGSGLALEEGVGESTSTSPYDLASGVGAKTAKKQHKEDFVVDAGDDVPHETGLKEVPKGVAQGLERGVLKELPKGIARQLESGEEPITKPTTHKVTEHIPHTLTEHVPHVSEPKMKHDVPIDVERIAEALDGLEGKVAVPEPKKKLAQVPEEFVQAVASNMPALTQVTQVREVLPTDKAEVARVHRNEMIQITEQLIQKLAYAISPDRTETSVTLKYPPIFDGVEIKVTEFKFATKELNVQFFNLNNPSARLIIENQANQVTLRENLIARGYTLHMLTIEPKKEGIVAVSTEETELSERRDEDQGGFEAGGNASHLG